MRSMLDRLDRFIRKERTKGKMIFRSIIILLGLVYFAVSLVAFLYKIDPLLFAVSIPWSMFISLLSNLIIRITNKGESFINAGMLVGSIVNVLLFWFFCYSAKNRLYRDTSNQR